MSGLAGPFQMPLHDLVTTSAAVAEASSRLAKIGLLSDLLRRVPPQEIAIAIGFLSGEPRQGRIGIGGATIWTATCRRVGTAATTSGAGSTS